MVAGMDENAAVIAHVLRRTGAIPTPDQMARWTSQGPTS
jgi:hypothetical protein